MGRLPIPVLERKMNTAFTLSPVAIDILDWVRGQKSRSAYVEELIQQAGNNMKAIARVP